MQATKRNASSGYMFGLSATLFLSFTGIMISYLNRQYDLPSMALAFWRDAFVASVLAMTFVFLSRRRFRLNGSHRAFFLLYGLSLALFNSSWTFSVQFNGAAVATVLAYSSPAITAVLAHYILREQINGLKLASIGLSLLGTVLVSGAMDPSAWKVHAAGIVFGLLSGFLFACYNLLGKTSANKSIDPWTTVLYGFSCAAFFLFLFNLGVNALGGEPLFSNFMRLGAAWTGWWILILLAIGPTLGGYGLYLVSLSYLPATVASLIGALEPAFTAIWAYLLLHEQLTLTQLGGSVLVLVSVILLRFGEASPEAVVAP